MKKINHTIVFWILTFVALLGGVVLVSQKQDTRKGAAYAKARINLYVPGTDNKISKAVNDEFSLPLTVTTGSEPLDAVRAYICYKKSDLGLIDSTNLAANFTNIDSNVSTDNLITKLVDDGSGNECLDTTFLSKFSTSMSSSNSYVKVADIKFKVKAAGSGTISIVKAKSELSGPNLNNVGDGTKKIEVDDYVGNVDYVFSAVAAVTVVPQGTPLLSFKIAYSGVKDANTQCSIADKLPVKVIVKNSGTTSKVYSVTPVRDGTNKNSSGDAIYKVQNLPLIDFNQTTGLSVFVKGPEHAQMRYGVSGQKESYTKADGEIAITADVATTPLLDFSEYSNLPGDINQDGKINAIDYSILKDDSHKTVSAGNYLTSDLNGDCQVNGIDTLLFIKSLQDKQDQLY